MTLMDKASMQEFIGFDMNLGILYMIAWGFISWGCIFLILGGIFGWPLLWIAGLILGVLGGAIQLWMWGEQRDPE